ncbi:MAG: NFACT RNA binding domain-containing protein [candidate division WOR-3 bacterium]
MHFSEFFFPVLKKEIDEIFKGKRVKKFLFSDKKFFVIFDDKNVLKISLESQNYYFLPCISPLTENKNFLEFKELPYLKDFVYKNSKIIEGERIFIANFVKKNPLGEIEKRKLIIDFTRRKKELLILKDEKVIYSFSGLKEFKIEFPDKINIFKENNLEKIKEYTQKFLPFLYEVIEREKEISDFKEILYKYFKGPFYVDKEKKLHLIKKGNFFEFKKLREALFYIYRDLEKTEIEKTKVKEKKEKILKKEKFDPEIYKIKGETILLNLNQILDKRGVFKLTHPENGEVEVEIKFSETPQKAAERYFERYKKLKRANLIKEKVEIEKEKIQSYKVYISPSGFKVLVSKSKEYANEVTFKIAKPNDYFFHVKDIRGAHVILKYEKNKELKEEDVKFAAELAKKHSKLKGDEKVYVLYTLRKYVKPIKGEKGLVRIKREKVILV